MSGARGWPAVVGWAAGRLGGWAAGSSAMSGGQGVRVCGGRSVGRGVSASQHSSTHISVHRYTNSQTAVPES
eukprot:COSAG01_NODE_5514_length_4207_cov_2.756934_5_plen_72_part_00